MSRPLSPAELTAHAAAFEAEADEIERRAKLEAAALRLQAAEFRDAAKRGLTIDANGVIIRHKMQAQPAGASRPRRAVGRKPRLDTPFRKWLNDTDETVEEYAARKRLKASTVKAWTIRGQMKGGRKIPRANAIDVQNEAGKDDDGNWRVPANDDTWPNGISD